jgi:hypothetical protein
MCQKFGGLRATKPDRAVSPCRAPTKKRLVPDGRSPAPVDLDSDVKLCGETPGINLTKGTFLQGAKRIVFNESFFKVGGCADREPQIRPPGYTSLGLVLRRVPLVRLVDPS